MCIRDRPQTVDHLPAHDQLARRLHAEALTSDVKRVLGHDLVRALANVAEWRGVGHGIVDVEQQQAADLRRFLLAAHLLGDEVLGGPRLALVLELLHVVAQGVDEVIGCLLYTSRCV